MADSKRKRTSRQSIQKGGGAATTKDLREKIKIRDKKESREALKKAERKLLLAVNKAKNALHIKGIQAHKDEKSRKDRIKVYKAQKELPPPADLILIRDPKKQIIVLE